MFIYNVKMSGNKLYKSVFAILIIISILLFGLSIYHIFKNFSLSENTSYSIDDSVKVNDVSEISAENYTNTLKQIHDNLDEYIGRKISFTGYIYKIDALEKNQFVLARNMIINQASQTVIVGFLCEYDNIDNFEELSWVHITGTIEKGYLDGDIPILKINNIEKTNKPKDEFVYPPDDTYIPTSVLY